MGWRILKTVSVDDGWHATGESWSGNDGKREAWSLRYTHAKGYHFEYKPSPHGIFTDGTRPALWTPPAEPISEVEFMRLVEREVSQQFGST